jgi:mannose-6-phosphate isomerase-like protein (cupin superfamily)
VAQAEGARGPVVRKGEGEAVRFAGLGVRFLLDGEATGGAFALVEHPIEPRALAAPVHTHSREDEYSYVLEGAIGVRVGEEELYAREGDLVLKPRGVPHAFWNPTNRPALVLEMIAPAGFEGYFRELAPLIPRGGPPDGEAIAKLQAKYGMEMDMDSIGELVERHGLAPPPG